MSNSYFVRCGEFGEITTAVGPPGLTRRCEVVMRTGLGVEIATVVRPISLPTRTPDEQIGEPHRAKILRTVTEDDRWLLRQLQRRRNEAVRECQQALREANFDGVLLDIVQQLDGTLRLHFMGHATTGGEITRPIIDRYESMIRSSHLSKRLVDGCGPNCGSDDSACKGSCVGCAVASKCGGPAEQIS